MQELSTLPVGPKEVSKVWYARARLAYAVLSAFVWSAEKPQGEWITFVPRVLEKGALYSTQLFHEILSMVSLVGMDTVVFWSDIGPHFRALLTLGSQAVVMLPEINKDAKRTLHVNYGLEKHAKSDADGFSL